MMTYAIEDPYEATERGYRLEALREYLVFRGSGMSHVEALARSTHHGSGELSREDNWDFCFRAVAATSLLTQESLTAEATIADLLKRKTKVEAIIESIHDQATSDGEDKASAQRAYLKYAATLDEMTEKIQKAAHDSTLRFAEQSALPYWQQRRQLIAQGLHEQYTGKGAQYDILCSRMVSAVLIVEQLEAAPVTIDATEYAKFNQNVINLANQLQKYTESTKSEAIRSEVQDALVRLMDLLESLIAPKSPALWADVVNEVVRRAGGIVTAGGGTKMITVGGVESADSD